MRIPDVVAAIIHHEGKILAAQRGYSDLAGSWEFPGGEIEPGETPEKALVRKLEGELDVDIAIDCLLETVDYGYDTFRLHMHCILTHITHGRIHLLEHSDAKWLRADDIDSLAWLPADIQIIEVIRRSGILE